MALAAKPEQAIRKAVQQQKRLALPVGGLNFVDNPMSMPDTDAYLIDNLIARSFGLELRKGWRNWISDGDEFDNEVRSIFTFIGGNPATNKLFCSPAQADGAIYDITAFDSTPVLAITPSDTPNIPGEWHTAKFKTEAGPFLAAISEGSGYFLYDGSTWTEVNQGASPGEVSFPGGDGSTLGDLCYVFAWKSRLWFLKSEPTVAYYLPLSSIAGVLTAFDFGPFLPHGGALHFGTSWTYDSGSGIDDSLVIASDQGDVLIYEGTDPDDADTFKQKGTWYVGLLPSGRRGFCQHGGDVLLASEYGITPLSFLVTGKLHTSQISGGLAYKINNKVARQISMGLTDKYWFLLPFPAEELLTVGTPLFNPPDGIRQSYMMDSITSTWATFSNMAPLCAEIFEGQYVFGARDGHVGLGFVGDCDGCMSDGDETDAQQVTGRLQSSFDGMGSPTMNKRVLRIKMYGIVDGQPSIVVAFKTEYDLRQLLSAPSPVSVTGPLWDTAKWDDAVWDAVSSSLHRWIGVAGFGKKLSLQMACRGVGENTLLTDYEVLFEEGINL